MRKESKPKKIKVGVDDIGRLDRFLVSHFPKYSRTFFKHLITAGKIRVNDKKITPHQKLRLAQTVQIDWPSSVKPKTKKPQKPKKLPFSIIYEDEAFMIVNKPANLVCHPPGRARDGSTLVEILEPWVSGEGWPDDMRPGMVHRLDRDTTGVIIFAKTPEAHHHISKQFANRQVKKTYVALVRGVFKVKEGTFECHIGRDPHKSQRFAVTDAGRLAITKFKIREKIEAKATVIELFPLTGRTHQLRVQLSAYQHPILGDHVYGKKEPETAFIKRQMLHAHQIQFIHPETGKKVQFKADLPSDFQTALKLLRSPKSHG